MFTITLPKYNYTLSYDRKVFTERFPNSMITRTLELTSDTEIPMEHPLITPQVLSLLNQILMEEHYPYVSSEIQKSLDYLGIDLPNIVYDHKYKMARNKYPEIFTRERIESKDDTQFYHFFRGTLATSDDISIPLLLLQYRDFIQFISKEPTAKNGLTPTLQYIIKKKSSDLLEVYVKKYPSAIEEYNIVDQILCALRWDLNNYLDYMEMLSVITPYLTPDGSQLELYNLVKAVYDGNAEDVEKYHELKHHHWIEDIDDNLDIILAGIALFEEDFDIARFIIRRHKYYHDKYGPPCWLDNLIDAYSYSSEITSEGVKLLLRYVPSKYRDNYANNLRRELSGKGIIF